MLPSGIFSFFLWPCLKLAWLFSPPHLLPPGKRSVIFIARCAQGCFEIAECRVYRFVEKGGQRAQFVMPGVAKQLPQDKRGLGNRLQQINVSAKFGDIRVNRCWPWIDQARIAERFLWLSAARIGMAPGPVTDPTVVRIPGGIERGCRSP